MTCSTAPTTIADYREAYREARGRPLLHIREWPTGFVIDEGYGPFFCDERDILAMTDRLRAEKARREGQKHG